MFDRFEYLISLVNIDLRNSAGTLRGLLQEGSGFTRFGTLNLLSLTGIDREAAAAGVNWPPLQAGFFGGSQERLYDCIPKGHFGETVMVLTCSTAVGGGLPRAESERDHRAAVGRFRLGQPHGPGATRSRAGACR